MKFILGGVAVLALIGALINSGHKSDSNSSSATASSSGSAHITLLRGASSDNSCQEEDGEARIYVILTLRNTGDAAGKVDPWAGFEYSDGGSSAETYSSTYGHDLTVPAHSERDATFYHTFNPQQHSMLRCAGYADFNDSNGKGWYIPIS